MKLTELEERVLACLGTNYPRVASSVADHIWPGHNMRAQGAGGAASRVLVAMKKKGLVRWVARDGSWGWIIG